MLSYSLAVASLYIVSGALGDRYGRWTLFVVGVAGFAGASALAGLAPNTELLIAGRVLQGVAGRAPHHEQPGAPAGDLRRGQRAGGRPVDRVERDRHDDRPAARRPARPVRLVALDLLPQPPVRGAGARHGVRRPSRRATGRRSRGRSSCRRAAAIAVTFGGAHLRADRRRPGGVRVGAGWAFALVGRRARAARDPASGGRTNRCCRPSSCGSASSSSPTSTRCWSTRRSAARPSTSRSTCSRSAVGYTPARASLIFLPISVVMFFLAARFGRLADRDGPRRYLIVAPIVMAVGFVLLTLVTEHEPARAAARRAGAGVRPRDARRADHGDRPQGRARPLRRARRGRQHHRLAPRRPDRDPLLGVVITLVFARRRPHPNAGSVRDPRPLGRTSATPPSPRSGPGWPSRSRCASPGRSWPARPALRGHGGRRPLRPGI